jgi:dTMP kinase
VICDRYLASTLVLQARDGVAASYLLALNEGIDLPGLAVILTAEPEIITARLDRRGRHDRFEHDPAAASTETAMFRDVAATLVGLRVPVVEIDTGSLSPQQAAGSQPDRRRMVALTTLTPDARDTFNGHLTRVASRSLGTSSAAAS